MAWDAGGIDAGETFRDPYPPPYAGEYCYWIFFGDPQGQSDIIGPACVDVPTSIAPPPPPPPTFERTPPPLYVGPPNAGAGTGAEAGNSAPAIIAAGGLAMLAAALALAFRRLRAR